MSYIENDHFVDLPLTKDGADWMIALMRRVSELDSDANARVQAATIALYLEKAITSKTQPATQDVRVFGPNLSSRGQAMGTFHVHAAECNDCKKYGPGRQYRGDAMHETPVETYKSVRDIVLAVYPPDDFCYDIAEDYGSYRADFYVAPCVTLPEEA